MSPYFKANTSISKTSKDIVETSKTIRPGAPIIEDWDTDSDNDSVFRPKSDQTKPRFTKINFVKYDENVKSVDKENTQRQVEYPRKIWNNAQRVNHQNKFTLPHPKRNFSPTAVVTKSGQVPVNTAKQSSPKATTSISTARPVNNARVNNVTTTGPKAVVSAAVRNGENAVKSSACWIWRPTGNVIDHTSKDSGSYMLKRFDYVDLQGRLKHMTGNKSFLIDYQEVDVGFVAFAGSPKGVLQMYDKKNSVLFTETECLVLSPDFKLLDESQVLLKVPRQNNMYSFDLKNVVPSGGLTCLFAKATIDESNLWHRRLGHINFKTMNKLVRGNLVRVLPSKLFENDHTCVACQKGKQHKASCKTKLVSSISQPLQMFHMDLFRTTSVRSINHKTYCLVVIDDYSRFSWVFFLATKDETSEILKTFITGTENQINHKISENVVADDAGKKTNEEPSNKGEGNGYANSTNRDSTVSPSVSTVGKKITNADDLSTDPLMPDLEDTGIFSGTYDDKDVSLEADLNNLETTMNVSPIPTTRIHKDHPKDQIIGDINLTTQTRRMTKISKEHAMEGIDYDEVFVLVAMIEAIRLFLAYVSFMGFIVYQMDVKSAYLYGTIEKEVYVCQPPGFEDPQFPDKVYKVMQRDDGIFISQDKYVADILKKFDFSLVKTTSTLIETNKELLKDKEAEDVDVHLYRSMIGSLMYLTASRPDIMFVVCVCARDSPFDLEAFSDSDYVGASLDRKSTTGDGISDEFGVKTGSYKVNAARQDLVLLGKNNTAEEVNSKNNSFFASSSIHYALTVSPTIYASYIEQFWATAKSKTINDLKQIHATVDSKTVVISESSVRSDLHFNDEDGITCLSNAEIFVNLALMGCDTVHTKKVFTNMKRQNIDFSGRITRLFASMLVPQVVEGEGSGQPSKPQPPSLTAPPSQVTTVTTQHQNTHKPRRAKRGRDTEIPQISGPPKKVGDEAVYTGEDDRVVRVATEAKQESRNIHKTRPTTTLNEPSPHGLGSGSRPRHQDTTLGGATAQTRFETVSKKSYDLPLLEGNTSGSREDSMEYQVNLTDFVPPTRHDSPLSGGHIPGSDEDCSRLGDPTDEKESQKIGKGTKGKNPRDEALQDCTDGPSNVSAAGPSTSTTGDFFETEMTTIADTLVVIRSARPSTTSVMIRNVEEEPRRATPVPIVQSQDKELAQRLFEEEQAQFEKERRIAREKAAKQEAKDATLIEQMEDVQARIDADELLVERLQQEERAQFTVDEQARMLVELIAERKKFFAAQRAKQIRNKPPTRAQLKNKMEQKWINDFVSLDSEMVKDSGKEDGDSQKQAESSKKRPRVEHDEECVKKQKLEDETEREELRSCLDIVPGDDIAIDFESLATKYPINDSRTHILIENMISLQASKERYETTSPKGYELLLWGDLKNLFEPSEEDEIWKNQQDYNFLS
ncbi:putative ribonuclease H-like domain-containing protein [Tanacetum coccineum]